LCPWWIWPDDHARVPDFSFSPQFVVDTQGTLLHPKRLSLMAAGQVPRAAPVMLTVKHVVWLARRSE